MACASGGRLEVAAAASQQFPAGLRVLVVDDDVTCLRVLEQMLRKCMYNVTSCSQATVALNLLRERKGSFDIVLSDVHMPDMDGFKLLELVGLEMDLPVIMMSGDGRQHLVLRGVRHGACDYLIKPIRDEELKNIWQHVVRKKQNELKEHDHSCSMEDHDRLKRAIDDTEYASSLNEGAGADEVTKTQKKRRDSKDEDDEESDDPTSKKPRVVWSVELHQQFVTAVNQLGIDKAVPKRILELMNVPGLTRENVASHLQKFRLYLKRLSGVAQQQVGLASYCGPVEQNLKLASLGRIDFQALAASGQLPPQTLAALHAELSRPTGNLILPMMDQRTLLHASLQGSKCVSMDQATYGQPVIKCSPNIAKQSPQPLRSNEDFHPDFAAWSSKNLGDLLPACNVGTVAETSGNMFLSFVQQQQKQSMMPEPSRSINVQPSCLVVPSQSSPNHQPGNSPASVNQNCSFRKSAVDYNNPSLQSNNSSGIGQVLESECKAVSVPSEFGAAPSVSSSSSCTRSIQETSFQRVRNPLSTVNTAVQLPNTTFMQSSYNGRLNLMQGLTGNPIFMGKGTSIPSRFAVDEQELRTSNLNQVRSYVGNSGNKVKQEPNMDLMENVQLAVPVQQYFSQNDLMSVFSD